MAELKAARAIAEYLLLRGPNARRPMTQKSSWMCTCFNQTRQSEASINS